MATWGGAKDQASALVDAVYQGRTDVVVSMLAAGVDPNVPEEFGKTALITASEEGHKQIVQILTDASADVNYGNKRGDTALICASAEGHLDIVRHLLANGAEIEMEIDNGYTALVQASKGGHDEVVKTLIQAGADVNKMFEDGITALTKAAGDGHYVVAKILIEAGACANPKGGDGGLVQASTDGHAEVVEVLLGAGADINRADEWGLLPLVEAAANGHMKTMDLLLARGADVNQQDGKRNPAIVKACVKNHLGAVKALLAAGAQVHLPGKNGYTALFNASARGFDELSKLLIANGADVNQIVEHGVSPLIIAANEGHVNVAKLLLDAGANVGYKNDKNESAAFAASRRGHLDVLKVFAEIDRAIILEESVVCVAERNGHAHVLEYFQKLRNQDSDKTLEKLYAAACAGHKDTLLSLLSQRTWDVGHLMSCLSGAIKQQRCLTTQVLLNHVTAWKWWDEKKISMVTREAVMTGHIDVVRIVVMLLEGCMPYLKDVKKHLHLNNLEYYDGQQLNLVDYNFFTDQSNMKYFIQDDMDNLIHFPGVGSTRSITGGKNDIIYESIVGCARGIFEQVHQLIKLELLFTALRKPEMSFTRCGSAAEGTKVGFPDEADFLVNFHMSRKKYTLTDEGSFKHAYVICKGKQSKFDISSQRIHNMVWSLLRKVCKKHDRVATDFATLIDSGHASTELAIRWPDEKGQFLGSVDMVPVVFFEGFWPNCCIRRTWMMNTVTLVSSGFALVARPPHKDSALGKSIAEEDRVHMWRLTFAHLETKHLAELDPRVKAAYIAAKSLRHPDVCCMMFKDQDGVIHQVVRYISSYILKTVFLHNVEGFLESKKTLEEMTYITYRDLVQCFKCKFVPLFWVPKANVLEGINVDVMKSLKVARLMCQFILKIWGHKISPDLLDLTDRGVSYEIVETLGNKYSIFLDTPDIQPEVAYKPPTWFDQSEVSREYPNPYG